jgi:hypothetical protein
MQNKKLKILLNLALYTLRRPKMDRSKQNVLSEYNAGWRQFEEFLDRADTVEKWLDLDGVDNSVRYCNIDGKLDHGAFNSSAYNQKVLINALRTHFPNARSFTEYGSGVGRNLLFLKQQMPHAECFGYELCAPGVEIGRAAAAKFGLDVKYEQLDFVNDPPEKYAHPVTDVAFTMYALEQIPKASQRAVSNMLQQVRLGSLHIEPVPENYPMTFRGILGKIEHWKADYLSGFDRAVRGMPLSEVVVRPVTSAHNLLMFPSLYVLRK